MNAPTLLTELHRRGITLVPEGERIHWRAPKGAFTPTLRAALAEHKPALLEILRADTPLPPMWAEDPAELATQLDDTFHAALERVAENLPPGAITWAAHARRDLIDVTNAAVDRLQAAYDARDMAALRDASEVLIDAYGVLGHAFTEAVRIGDPDRRQLVLLLDVEEVE